MEATQPYSVTGSQKQGISSCKSDTKNREVANKIKHNRLEYENFQPLLLPNMTKICENNEPSQSETGKADENCLYETVPLAGLHQMSNGGQNSAYKADKQNDVQQSNPRRDVKIAAQNQLHLYNTNLVAELNECFENGLKIKRRPETNTKPLIKPKNPKQYGHANAVESSSYELQFENRIPWKTDSGTPAPVKQRLSDYKQPDVDRKNTASTSPLAVYENKRIDRAEVRSIPGTTSAHITDFKGKDRPKCQTEQMKEIANFQPHGTNRKVADEIEDSSLIYANVQMQMSTNIEEGVSKSLIFPTKTASTDDHGLQDPMVPRPLYPLERDGTKLAFAKNEQNETKQNGKQTAMPETGKKQLHLQATKKPPLSAKPSIVSLETKSCSQRDYKQTHETKKEVPCDAVNDIHNLKTRHYSAFSLPEAVKQNTDSTIILDSDENIGTDRTEKSRMPNPKPNPSQNTQSTSGAMYDRQLQNKPPQLKQQDQLSKSKTINVKQLKVKELGVLMTEKLRLGKYVSRFAEEMIDGAMLIDLEEDLLKGSFGLSVIEAKRLRKFAKEGYVPT